MGEDVLASRYAEQREPAGRIAHARDGLEADVVRPPTRPVVTTSVIAAPISRMVVGGGADPSGVTSRPDTRTAGTGRSEIVMSVRSSPASSAICVAAPGVAAAAKYVVGYTDTRPAADGGGGISTRLDVSRATSPTCCVRGCPSSDTSPTPAKKRLLRSAGSGRPNE